MFTDEDMLPISALQHLAFCERQWALIHLEGLWAENRLTAEGGLLHDRVHEPATGKQGLVRITRGLRLRSTRLGLTGIADVVEFHNVAGDDIGGITLEGIKGRWKPVIVEYKRGRPKVGHEDAIQVCAQALCLKEMIGGTMCAATIFYGQPRRRHDVVLDDSLVQETIALATRLHKMTQAGTTPTATYNRKCESCSLLDVCLPRAIMHHVGNYVKSMLNDGN